MYVLGDISRKGAVQFPNREAIVFENTRLTYKKLNERVNRFANALRNKGYEKGDRLADLSSMPPCGRRICRSRIGDER